VKLGPGLSFSWKRALGVTKAKRRVSSVESGNILSLQDRLQGSVFGVKLELTDLRLTYDYEFDISTN